MSLSIRTPRSGCPATTFQSSQLASPAPANNNDRDHDEEQDAAATSPTKNIVPSLGAAEDLDNDNSLISSDAAAHNLLSIKSTTVIVNTTTIYGVVDDVVAPKSESPVRETVADENIVAASSIVDATTTTVVEAPVGADIATTAVIMPHDAAPVACSDEEAVVVADTVISHEDVDEFTTDALPTTAAAHLSTSFTTAAGVPILLLSASFESTDVIITRRPFASPRQILDTTSNDAVITSLTTPSKSSQCHHYHSTPSAPSKPARDCAFDDDESSTAHRAVCIRLFASDAGDMEAEIPRTTVTSTFVAEGSQEVQRNAARRELFPNVVAVTIGSKRSRSETPTPQTPENDNNNMVHDDNQKNSSNPLYSQHSTTTTSPLPNNNNNILTTLSSCADATAANSTTGAADAQVMDDEDHPTPLLAPASDNDDDVDTTNTTDNIDTTATDSLVHPPMGFSVGGRPLDDDVKFVMETCSKVDEAAVVAECPTAPSTTMAQDVIEGPCGGADVDDVVDKEEAALLLPTE